MASTAEVQEIVLGSMRALYRTPYGVESVDEALAEYAKVLRRFDADALERGWERVTVTHKRRDWPSVAEIRESVDAMKPQPKQAPANSFTDEDKRTPEEKARVKKLFEIWHRHGKSWTDTSVDPEFMAMRDDFMKRNNLPMLPIEFRDMAFQFVNRNRQTKKDFKDAGVMTFTDECALYFRDHDAVCRIRDWYGAQISEFLGFDVPLKIEPLEVNGARWTNPRWTEPGDYWAPKAPLFSSTPFLAEQAEGHP